MPDICDFEWYEYIFIAISAIAITFTIINLLDITKLWYMYVFMTFGGIIAIVCFCFILSRYGDTDFEVGDDVWNVIHNVRYLELTGWYGNCGGDFYFLRITKS